ncbi:MarR family winged helix-turn-helix transcriptional regulator [Granulosicoccus sp. 3-233]|uniref:MarR family winged helix-turn-helix transcriptional regulator n=1 Tax=Granulosicoccus sp. 3-233 TaxID=3417969 RepID=UPI003D3570DB
MDKIISQWQTERPDLDVTAMAQVGRLSVVSHLFSRQMGKVFAHHGLNAAGFDVLATLRRSSSPHALTAGELMASMMITSGTMTNRIDQLVKAGLVMRKSDSADARRILVRLTPKGKRLIDKVVAEHVENQAGLLEALDESERELLDSLLRKLLASVVP